MRSNPFALDLQRPTLEPALPAPAKSSPVQEMREEGPRPDVVTYTTALHCCGRHGEVEDAEALLAAMAAAGVQPNVMSYSCVLDACAKAGRMEHAMRVLHRMAAAGVEPNHVAYTSVIDACVRHGSGAALDQAPRPLPPFSPAACLFSPSECLNQF